MEECASGPFRIRPAREEDIVWAAALGRRVYYGQDAISPATMLDWFRTNPHGFSTFWHEGTRIGNFDLLPLRPAVLQDFVAGRVMEKDFSAANLFSPAEADQIHDLHWESIVLDPEFHGARSRVIRLFLRSYPRLLARLCPVEQIGSVYAIAASRQGERLLRRTGLSVLGEASTRLDAHPLYCGTLRTYRDATADQFRTDR